MPRSLHPLPKCYLVIAYAPAGVTAAEGNRAFNAYIADPARGLVLTHDHFVGTVGGYAVFACATPGEVKRLQAAPELPGWSLHIHPLTFAATAVEWLYQADFTLAAYRGRRLAELYDDYLQSEQRARLEQRMGSPGGFTG